MFSILDPNRSLFLEARRAKRLPNACLATAILILLLFGFFTSCYCLREGSVWGICGWHAAWNWAQGNLFGMRVSGHEMWGGTLLDLEAAGPSVLSGGDCGPEASLFGKVVFLAGAVLVLARPFRREFHRPASGHRGRPAPKGGIAWHG